MNIHLIPQALRNIHKLLDNAPSDGFDETMYIQILEELDAIGEIRLGELDDTIDEMNAMGESWIDELDNTLAEISRLWNSKK
jgi:ACT domain-containing protein